MKVTKPTIVLTIYMHNLSENIVLSPLHSVRGWSGGAMILGKFPVSGVLLIWIRVGQGPSVLAVGAGGGCLDIFSLVYHFSFFLPLSGRRPDID